MQSERIITIALALGVGGSVLTSCGADTEALSKPEFIELANAICEAADDKSETIFDAMFADLEDLDFEEPADAGTIFTRFAEGAAEAQPIWEQMANDIRDLHEPDGDHDVIEALLDDLENTVEEFIGQTAAAADGDEAAMEYLDDESGDPFDDVNRRAREYGLTVCGQED